MSPILAWIRQFYGHTFNFIFHFLGYFLVLMNSLKCIESKITHFHWIWSVWMVLILMAEKARLYHFEKYYSIQNRPPIPMIVTIDEFSKIWHLVQMFVKLSSPYGQKLDQNWEDWLNWDLSEQFTSNICFFFWRKKGDEFGQP